MALSGSEVPAGPRPVLGLTTYLQRAQTGVWDVPASFLPANYIQGVTAAGGTAVLLPPQPVDDIGVERVLAGLDGLVLTGGLDIDPGRYGQPPHPATDNPGLDRDGWEFALLRGALARRLPVLGICRGAQLLNVACGGTLHQHLPDVVGHPGHQAGNAVFSTSTVRTAAGSRLAEVIGESTEVQCYHHQAIAELGAGLVVAARDDEGVIEAIEFGRDADGARPWVLAVQWHPEERLDDQRLFAAVVAAAGEQARKRGQ